MTLKDDVDNYLETVNPKIIMHLNEKLMSFNDTQINTLLNSLCMNPSAKEMLIKSPELIDFKQLLYQDYMVLDDNWGGHAHIYLWDKNLKKIAS